MSVVVGYVATPEGTAALEAAVHEAPGAVADAVRELTVVL